MFVIPAKAGNEVIKDQSIARRLNLFFRRWTPAVAGVTKLVNCLAGLKLLPLPNQ